MNAHPGSRALVSADNTLLREYYMLSHSHNLKGGWEGASESAVGERRRRRERARRLSDRRENADRVSDLQGPPLTL